MARQTGEEGGLLYVAGNKVDIENRAVTTNRALEWCEERGFPYFDVSAQTGERVELLFMDVAEKLARARRPPEARLLPEPADAPRGCCGAA